MAYRVDGIKFQYRKQFTINVAATDLKKYQIKKTIQFLPGMQNDMCDRRFTTLGGFSISYWDESVIDCVSSETWLKIPNISSSGQTKIWMYYGNAGAVSGSSGTDTFIQFNGQTTSSFKLANVQSSPFIAEARVTQTDSATNDIFGVANGAWVPSDDTAYMALTNIRIMYTVTKDEGALTDELIAGAYSTDAVY